MLTRALAVEPAARYAGAARMHEALREATRSPIAASTLVRRDDPA